MIKQIIFPAIILLISINSCSKNCPADFNECQYFEKPDSAYVNLEFTINNENPSVDFEIFRGNYNDPNPRIVFSGTTNTPQFFVFLPLGFYSVKAIYQRGNQEVWVVNAGKSRAIEFNCDYTCFDVKEADIEVTLK